jgi:uncharacterized protein with PQ loop repeat|eukprot:COSAG01_NODE_330_length_18723_cov_96.763155_16_plen_100_part_00
MDWAHWSDLPGYDRYMLFVGVLGKAFVFIQIITILLNQSSENVSFSAYLVYFLTSLSWLFFGILTKNTVVTASGYVGIVAALVAMNIVIIYKENKSDIL